MKHQSPFNLFAASPVPGRAGGSRRVVRTLGIAAACFGAMISSVPATITYVDATDGAAGNTALAAGGTWTATPDPTATGTDNLWRRRTGLANGSTIFEASGQGIPTDDAPRLVTTISGLIPGLQYNFFAFFWSPNDANQQWMFRAGLSNPAGDLPSWSRSYNDTVNNAAGVVSAAAFPITPDNVSPFPALGPADFSNPASLVAGTTTQGGKTVLTESGRFLWEAILGTGVADANGQALIYIDDYVIAGLTPPNGPDTVNHRTWFDGAGFEAVPEPSTFALTGIGLAGWMVRLRRKNQ